MTKITDPTELSMVFEDINKELNIVTSFGLDKELLVERFNEEYNQNLNDYFDLIDLDRNPKFKKYIRENFKVDCNHTVASNPDLFESILESINFVLEEDDCYLEESEFESFLEDTDFFEIWIDINFFKDYL